jgi:cyclophilin family peptidyl-prolyl cis-trans isomerase
MGRRKLALSTEARKLLVIASANADRGVRYAATYALSREHDPPEDTAVNKALASLTLADESETQAAAIAGLARRKAVFGNASVVETAMLVTDWRVAVEAVRALASDKARHEAVSVRISRIKMEPEAHVAIEALHKRTLFSELDMAHVDEAAAAAKRANLPALAQDWIGCLAQALRLHFAADRARDLDLPCGALPERQRQSIVAELVSDGAGTPSSRRQALRQMLEHSDSRIRAAAFAPLVTTWKDGDAADHHAIVGTFVSALASTDLVIAGSAIDAVGDLLDVLANDPDKPVVEQAIATRAAREPELELSASLYELIGKHQIAVGADACRSGLSGAIVRARAAVACLKALGEAVPPPELRRGAPPPVQLEDVIGKDLYWHVATTRGELVIHLRPEVAPWNVATIVALTRRGFYDGLGFHRVVPNFVVQGGDPTESGWGGPGFTTPAEPATFADGPGFVAGAIGIADAGRDSGGSQWFAMHSRAPHLDGRYTWIGEIVSGGKSADALLIGDKIVKATIEVR